MTIEVILFDFGGVLWVPLDEARVRTKRDQLAMNLGFSDGDAMWQYFYRGEEWQLTKTGQWLADQMWKALLSPFGLTTRARREAFLDELFEYVGVKPEMVQLLEQLVKTHELAILSNASDLLEWRLNEEMGIGHFFSEVINSHRIGFAKPDIETYQIALDRLSVKPGALFFVDDQVRNTLAAESLGIRSHIFSSVGKLRQELVDIGVLD